MFLTPYVVFSSLADPSRVNEDKDAIAQIPNLGEDSETDHTDLPSELSILPLKNAVLFPGVIIPITVTRKKSIELIDTAYNNKKMLGVVTQQNNHAEEPSTDDLYRFGTVASIVKALVMPSGSTTIIVQGKSRFQIVEFISENPQITAKVEWKPDDNVDDESMKIKKLFQSLKDAAAKILQLDPTLPKEASTALRDIQAISFLIHFLSSNMNIHVRDKQKILETGNLEERGALLLKYMTKEIQRLEINNKIQKKVHTDIDKQQRDYILRQQIKALQDELGYESTDQDIAQLSERAKGKKWSSNIAEHFNKELEKLQRISPQAAEYAVAMSYVEFMLDLPWKKYTRDSFDINRAKRILNSDHFGIKKVKDRILEYLAVLKLKRDMKGPILCLYGPPGVGKTSLGKSIARSLKRNYVKMSLGGMHDEAEIRGHRKTYVGAMPGKILQQIKKVKYSNPVFILDEIDKVRSNFTGDPSSALLEVLDPEQNNAFIDNYLEIDYDLSKVLFIATANSLDTIQPALRDRMEIIEINGYTVEEKEQIAKQHLIPKQLEEHGLQDHKIHFTGEATRKIIKSYTCESGVRDLERKIGSIARSIAKSIVMEEKTPQKIDLEYIKETLGIELFDEEPFQDNHIAGIVTGLAWTRVGGDIIFVESSLSQGKGALTLSGQLGEVMKESATTALSYLKAKAPLLGIDQRIFQQYDLHIHVPAGAIPKDGPSAGITMLTALTSVFTQRKVKLRLAMTGEITLRGKVLPVGGIKEKILAAKRYGIKEIILSRRNQRDIEEIEKNYIKGLKFHFVDGVDEVLKIALLKEKVKQPLSFQLKDPYIKQKQLN